MNNAIDYKSRHYEAVKWGKLFYFAGIVVSKNNMPIGIVNSNGLIMLSNNAFRFDKIELCFEDEVIEILSSDIKQVFIDVFNVTEISFYQIKYKKFSEEKSNQYIKFILEVLNTVFKVTKNITVYTYEHLSERCHENKLLSKIELVQSHFSDIFILLSKIQCLILRTKNTDEAIFIIIKILKALKILSKLSGARAVLKNNVIELIFYLKLFQKFISQ